MPTLSSLLFQEDDWTKRLSNSIPYCLKSIDRVKYSCRDGPRFDVLQHQYSSILITEQYLFHGAPDVIISSHRHKLLELLVDVEGDDDSVLRTQDTSPRSSSSSEDDVIEANRGVMTVHRGMVLPEKLGQLIAAMHTLAIAKVIRGAIRGKRCDDVTVRGMVLDKSVGGFFCSLNVGLSEPNNPTKLKIKCESFAEPLDAPKLCYLLHYLVK